MLFGLAGTPVSLTLRDRDGLGREITILRTAEARDARPRLEERSFDGSEYADSDASGSMSERRKCGIGMTFKSSSSTGMLIVRRVKEGGPAEAAGIEVDDTIVSIDGQIV
eukprot:363781-Rhodomonas_salina.1